MGVDKKSLSEQIKQKGQELGFKLVGISEAAFLEQEAKDLEKWLKKGQHGTMTYMENHFDKRTDPRLLVEGAKSVISFIHNYYPGEEIKQAVDAPKISSYAWGEDYHRVLKRKLYTLLDWMKQEVGEIHARVFTDSAPVMDKAWAKRSGLGWIGKNTNLIHPKIGSWFFIGEIILDLELEYDGPIKDYCGTCTRCIDACPTEALSPYQIEAHKCISYLTIELKDDLPEAFHGKMDEWAYGCDICQTVCPWNSFSSTEGSEAFSPLTPLLTLSKRDWKNLSKSQFKKITRETAMSRIKWEKWQNNLQSTETEK